MRQPINDPPPYSNGLNILINIRTIISISFIFFFIYLCFDYMCIKLCLFVTIIFFINKKYGGHIVKYFVISYILFIFFCRCAVYIKVYTFHDICYKNYYTTLKIHQQTYDIIGNTLYLTCPPDFEIRSFVNLYSDIKVILNLDLLSMIQKINCVLE